MIPGFNEYGVNAAKRWLHRMVNDAEDGEGFVITKNDKPVAVLIGIEEYDRRTFHGEWPGPCPTTPGCVLPSGHRGRCAT